MTKATQNKKLEKIENISSENANEMIKISDLGVASAIITAGFEIVTMDKEDPRRVKFVFSRKREIEKVVDEYWANHLKQKTRSFWDNVKNLKNMLKNI